ncbi:MAG: hypothetical protein AAGF72_18355 [Pseudomonadota bacterium]
MTPVRRSVVVAASIAALFALAALLALREPPKDNDVPAQASAATEVRPLTPSPAQPRAFHAAELQSALTAVCSNSIPAANSKAWTQEEVQTQIKAIDELKQSVSGRLSVSASAEHLHLAALLEDDPALRIELLSRAISNSPSDPFLLWRMVQVCPGSAEFIECSPRVWEQRLIAVDGQNSESWLRVASNRYRAGETGAALHAMRHAAAAAESRIYWTETIEMIERGLAAAGSDFPFPERAGMAFGLASMALPMYGDITAMCLEQSSLSADWAYTCLGYGALAEKQAKTEIGVSVGRSIQKLALEALGEREQAAEVEQRIQKRREEMLDSIEEHNPAIEHLIISSPALFSTYLAAIRSDGEEAARHRITAEIKRLLEHRPELACESTATKQP